MLNNLGEEARSSGDLDRAAAYLLEALALYQDLGVLAGVAMVQNNMGCLALGQGDSALAAERFAESLPLCLSANNPQTISSFSLLGLAEVAVAQGRLERAALLFGAVDKLTVTSGDPSEQLPPHDREDADRALATARAGLGEQAFAAAWQAGTEMTLEQAAAYALEAV